MALEFGGCPECLMSTVAALGAAIGIGQLLNNKETIGWKLALGRAIVTAGIAMSAGAAATFIPNISNVAVIGIACLLASLGTSGLEMFAKRLFGITEPRSEPETYNPPQ